MDGKLISIGGKGPWKCLIAERVRERMHGLLGRAGLETGTLMLLDPCGSVHTFGMKFPIDLIFLDKNRGVLKVSRNVRPCRIACGGIRAKAVLEAQTGWLPELARGEVAVIPNLASRKPIQ
jgi:uncharacterized membrane protein (UPF0127 family)